MDECQLLEEKIETKSDCNCDFQDNQCKSEKMNNYVYFKINSFILYLANEVNDKKRKISTKITDTIETNAERSANPSGFPLSNSTNRETW